MSEISIIQLDYEVDLSNRYANLCDLPGFVLLESSDNYRGRYDIMSAYPYETITTKEQGTDLFSVLNNKIKPIKSSLELPFQGGAIGYFSYDLASELMGINSSNQINVTNMPTSKFGLYDWAIITDHILKKVILFSANTQKDTALITNIILEKWKKNSYKVGDFSILSELQILIKKEEYFAAIHSIKKELNRGRCYQINYTQPFQLHYSGRPWEIYTAIKKVNNIPFGAYLSYPEGNILSFSPERLLLMDKDMVLTSPIKGSCKRSINKLEDKQLSEDLLVSEKNRAENVMIVDLLRNDLGKIAQAGSVNVKALCQLESYEKVHHLVSYIEAYSKENILLFDVFKACFPGGSITGVPKKEAMKVIAEHETFKRGIYCGNIGYFSAHGRFDTNIAIRTLVAKDDTLYFAAGGGIVMDSIADEEYLECFIKIQAILQGLKR